MLALGYTAPPARLLAVFIWGTPLQHDCKLVRITSLTKTSQGCDSKQFTKILNPLDTYLYEKRGAVGPLADNFNSHPLAGNFDFQLLTINSRSVNSLHARPTNPALPRTLLPTDPSSVRESPKAPGKTCAAFHPQESPPGDP